MLADFSSLPEQPHRHGANRDRRHRQLELLARKGGDLFVPGERHLGVAQGVALEQVRILVPQAVHGRDRGRSVGQAAELELLEAARLAQGGERAKPGRCQQQGVAERDRAADFAAGRLPDSPD